MIRKMVRRGVNVEIDVADEDLPIMGDIKMLSEALACLIENANDAVLSGGAVAVATRKVERNYESLNREGFFTSTVRHAECCRLRSWNR